MIWNNIFTYITVYMYVICIFITLRCIKKTYFLHQQLWAYYYLLYISRLNCNGNFRFSQTLIYVYLLKYTLLFLDYLLLPKISNGSRQNSNLNRIQVEHQSTCLNRCSSNLLFWNVRLKYRIDLSVLCGLPFIFVSCILYYTVYYFREIL